MVKFLPEPDTRLARRLWQAPKGLYLLPVVQNLLPVAAEYVALVMFFSFLLFICSFTLCPWPALAATS
jgi:hypothetical protein